jgi:hypothetical protein
MSTHYFSCWGGTCLDSTKSRSGVVTLNCCFSSGLICGSHSALPCVWDAKCQRTIFHGQVGPVRNVEALFVMLRWDR